MSTKPIVKSKPPTFLLCGIAGVYNYGCEAIVRGTTLMLRERWPNCRVIYASLRVGYDRTALRDVDGLEVVPAFRKYGMTRILRAILRRIMPGKRFPWLLNPALVRKADVVLSIGGDIYTLSGRERGDTYYNPLAELGDRILSQGKPYVLWGASVGPFDAFPPSIDYYSGHLSRIPLITVREPRTAEYLRRFNCKGRVVPVADPAFLMPPKIGSIPFDVGKDDLLVAINLSPLSLWYTFGPEESKSQKLLLVESIRAILDIPNARVILVPHTVIKDYPLDDDYGFLREIYSLLNRKDGRIVLLPENLGARGTKAVLAACHIAVAARMHCGIAAVSSGVPTIFIGYSDKAKGMVQYVYGNNDWLLPLKEATPQTLRERVVRMLGMRDQISDQIRSSRSRWEKEARDGVDALASVVGGA